MVKNQNATTSALKDNTAGAINQVTIDANVNDKIPKQAKELESILEFFFSGSGYPVTISGLDSKKAVHSISLYNEGKYFAVSMYSRVIDMVSIDTIEKMFGYRLHRINMQTGALFFWKVKQ